LWRSLDSQTSPQDLLPVRHSQPVGIFWATDQACSAWNFQRTVGGRRDSRGLTRESRPKPSNSQPIF
jgi:hypothetical protein